MPRPTIFHLHFLNLSSLDSRQPCIYLLFKPQLSHLSAWAGFRTELKTSNGPFSTWESCFLRPSCPWPYWLPSLSIAQVDSWETRASCLYVLEAHASSPLSSSREQSCGLWSVPDKEQGSRGPQCWVSLLALLVASQVALRKFCLFVFVFSLPEPQFISKMGIIIVPTLWHCWLSVWSDAPCKALRTEPGAQALLRNISC